MSTCTVQLSSSSAVMGPPTQLASMPSARMCARAAATASSRVGSSAVGCVRIPAA